MIKTKCKQMQDYLMIHWLKLSIKKLKKWKDIFLKVNKPFNILLNYLNKLYNVLWIVILI